MNYIKYLSLIFAGFLVFTSCVDQEFDEPPYESIGDDPSIDASKIKSMDEIKALSSSGDIVSISEDWYIQGLVISDDKTGNFYKVLYLQDEKGDGGLQISIDATELHATYPLYRRVFVSLKDLYIGKSNNAWVLGTAPDDGLVGRIPQALVGNYLIGGKYKIPLEPTEVAIGDLDDNKHANTLVKLNGMQFPNNAIGGPYAGEVTTNHELTDCAGNTITLRNSSYADFKEAIVPEGNGSIIAVYSLYRDFKQLFIRDTSDVDFSGTRCGAGSGDEESIDIGAVRSLFNGGTSTVPENKKIRGIVISDQSNGNAPHSQNIVIQDGTGGIEVRFTGDHSFNLNDDVEIVIGNAELAEYKGSLQINNVALGAATRKGTDGGVSPRVVSIQDVLDNASDWQSTLVKIENVNIELGTFNGNKSITDASGSMILRTSSYASFADESVPSGEVTLVGIVSHYDGTEQIKMRSRSDVTGGGTGGGDEESISIAEVRSLFNGGASSVAGSKKIRGIVISDQANGNAPHSQNIVIQEGIAGIEVRFTEDHSFSLNDEVEVIVSGAALSEYKGTLQINNVSLGAASVKGTGSVTPRTANIQDVLDNASDWQSTLVKIENVTIEQGTFNGNRTLNDASGEMILRTSSYASFADESVPSDEVNLVGIVSHYDGTEQIKMRSRSDVTGGGTSGGGDDIFKDDFESGIGAWNPVSVVGDQVWVADEVHGNPGTCAKMTGYDGEPYENDDWLISPAIDLSAVSSATLSFETAMNYDGNELELFVSTDYSGSGAPSTANWDSMSFSKSTGSWEWVGSGDIDLSGYAGNTVFIAYRFTSGSDKSSTWEVDNVVVK